MCNVCFWPFFCLVLECLCFSWAALIFLRSSGGAVGLVYYPALGGPVVKLLPVVLVCLLVVLVPVCLWAGKILCRTAGDIRLFLQPALPQQTLPVLLPVAQPGLLWRATRRRFSGGLSDVTHSTLLFLFRDLMCVVIIWGGFQTLDGSFVLRSRKNLALKDEKQLLVLGYSKSFPKVNGVNLHSNSL